MPATTATTRTTPPVSRKAQQSEKTREALLARCLVLFAERGVAATSIDEIARAAGVTKGAMYWHFSSKDELLLAILNRIRGRWLEKVHAPVSTQPTPTARLARLFDGYAELFRQSPEICLFLQQVLLDRHHQAFSARVAKVFATTARFIAAIIDEGQAAGTMRRDVESLPTAHLILGMLAGASQQAATARGMTLPLLIAEAKAMTLARLER